MKVRIEIECNNAAFEGEEFGHEMGRIFRRLAEDFEDHHTIENINVDESPIRDINGNTVGKVIFE